MIRKLISRLPWAVILALPFVLAGGILLAGAFLGTQSLAEFLEDNPSVAGAFASTIFENPNVVRIVLLALGGVMLLTGVLALIRKPFSLPLVRGGFFALYAILCAYTFFVLQLTGRIQTAQIKIDGEALGGPAMLYWYLNFFWFVFPLVLLAAITQLYAICSNIDSYYGRTVESPTRGDRVFETVWTKRVRSIVYSTVVHGLCILIPFLLSMISQKVEAYSVPFGKGLADAGGGGKKKPPPPKQTAKAAGKKTVKVKSTRDLSKLKGVIFSSNAGRENSTDEKVASLVADMSQQLKNEYSATRTGEGQGIGPGTKRGRIGAGGEGEGGYPWGKKNAIIRFIRLQYDGEGWDDGMSAEERADLNFLDFFHDVVGFKVSDHTEAISIHQLKLFRKGEAPPFVFMKGEAHIGNVPPSDVAVLRNYLLGGGMVFADAGSLSWGRDFEGFVARVLPDLALIDIPDDDPIYQVPYQFPNGAPPMWHHAGMRARGCKYQGRWCVFYHPGDVSDAWKNGHDGLTPEKAEAAFQIGLNVMLYSFNHYYEINKP